MYVYDGGPFPVTYAVYGDGPPVLMITGMASVLDWFQFNIPAFVAAGYQVIAQDLRGANRSGISAAPGPYSAREMAADSLGILDEMGVERADIVGLSMGGMVAQHLAITHGERCRRVSIVGNGLARMPAELAASPPPRADEPSVEPQSLDDELAAALAASFTSAFQQEKPERHASFAHMYRKHRARPETLAAQVEAAFAQDTLDELDRITVPVQLLVGELDTINAAHVGEMSGRIRHAESRVLPGMAHGLNFEHADEYNELVLGFLRSSDGEAR